MRDGSHLNPRPTERNLSISGSTRRMDCHNPMPTTSYTVTLWRSIDPENDWFLVLRPEAFGSARIRVTVGHALPTRCHQCTRCGLPNSATPSVRRISVPKCPMILPLEADALMSFH